MITLGEYGGHVYISGAQEVIVIVQVAEKKMEHGAASVRKIRRRGSDFVFSIGNFLYILVRFTF